jgi:hypothetical protein
VGGPNTPTKAVWRLGPSMPSSRRSSPQTQTPLLVLVVLGTDNVANPPPECPPPHPPLLKRKKAKSKKKMNSRIGTYGI